ncbi:hypothetical protein JFN87_08895, partial [Streptomyces bomunensis]|nr:hypothetical protein [Streptomyces montanisoli]
DPAASRDGVSDPSPPEPVARRHTKPAPARSAGDAPASASPSRRSPDARASRDTGPTEAQDAQRPPGRTEAVPASVEPASVATFGAGIMLLGLGLAFIALRLRRR